MKIEEGKKMSVGTLLSTAVLVTAASLATAAAGSARAATIPAVDAGFVTEAGGSAKGDGTLVPSATFNYSVGRELHYGTGFLGSALAPLNRNNYFVFDLSGAPAMIATATLKIHAGTLESIDTVEEFVLLAPFDPGGALGDAGFLMSAHAAGTSAFDDPGDLAIGVAMAMHDNIAGGAGPLGAAAITFADDGVLLSIPLMPAGVAYLNGMLGGMAILGGTVTTAPPPGTPQQPFGLTGPDLPGGDPLTPHLEVTYVPEPASLFLLAIGGLILSRRNYLIALCHP